MTDGIHYVRNEIGAIHSVDEDHFNDVLHETTRNGTRYLKTGWAEISEDEARAGNPQLFGHPDPDIVRGMTSAEIKEARERRAFEQQLAAELAADLEDLANPKGK